VFYQFLRPILHLMERLWLIYWAAKSKTHLASSTNWDRSAGPRQHHWYLQMVRCYLTRKASVMARWQEHFSTLLKWPLHPPPSALLSEAATCTPDPLIDTFPFTLIETHKTANKIMAGKAPGSCDVCLPRIYLIWWH